MSTDGSNELRQRHHLIHDIETDPRHHLAGPFVSPEVATPPYPPMPRGMSAAQISKHLNGGMPPKQGLIKDTITLRWLRAPSSSIKGVLLPIVLWANWHFFTPHLSNPFAPFLFVSYPAPSSTDADPRYQKGYLDLLFISYYIVVFSFLRQTITIHIFQRFARWWGIRSSGKIERFGEQGYAFVYFSFTGIWGTFIMRQLPTWWYRTEYFWRDYPHWQMPGSLKQYYLVQTAYWLQQFLVLVLKLEKPRSDFVELCIHHIVTLWLIGWSYLVNLTLIGTAVFVSMDIPDSFLALSKLLNYMGLSLSFVSFAIFVVVWSYFRHYLNLVILKSVWEEYDLIPETSKRWAPSEGSWLVWWMQYQVLIPIGLLQLVQLFWYFLIWRILFRAVFQSTLDDERSDDEEDDKND